MVLVNRLIESSNFIPVKSTYSTEDYAMIFTDEIVCLRGFILSIILHRVAQFTSRILRSFKKGLGTNVNLSTALNPQTDGKAEHTIQTVEGILRACIIYFKGK